MNEIQYLKECRKKDIINDKDYKELIDELIHQKLSLGSPKDILKQKLRKRYVEEVLK